MSTSYIGSKISLISRAEIRYEGTLFMVDQEKSTITLAKVRTFGTENRETDHPMPPRDEVFEYIIFKATDIKDIMVCELAHGGLPFDPAIVSVSVNKSPGLQTQPPTGGGHPSNFGPAGGHHQQQSHLLTSGDLSAAPKYDNSRLSSPPLSPHQLNQQQHQFLQQQNRAPGAGRQQQQQQHQQNAQHRPQDFYSAAHQQQSPAGQQQQHQHQIARSYSRRDEDVESVDDARSRGSFQARGADMMNMYRQQTRGSYSNNSRGSRTQDRPIPFQQQQNFRGVSSAAGYRVGGHFDGSYRDKAAAGLQQQLQQQQRMSQQQQMQQQQQQQMPRGLSIAGGGGGRAGSGSIPWGSGRGGSFVSRGFLHRGGGGGPRGGSQSGSSASKRFDSDYDFEKANEQFIEAMNNLKVDFSSSKAKIATGETKENDENRSSGTNNNNNNNNVANDGTTTTTKMDAAADKSSTNKNDAKSPSDDATNNKTLNDSANNGATSAATYDKQKSFFDNISCEALEILEGANASRTNYRRERELNQETFGQASLQHRNFGAYRRGYGRFNGPNRGGRGGGGFNSRDVNSGSQRGGASFNRYR